MNNEYKKPLENNPVAFIMEKVKKEGKMVENTYTLIREFECCGKSMVTVIIEERAACIMLKSEYDKLIEDERKYMKNTNKWVA